MNIRVEKIRQLLIKLNDLRIEDNCYNSFNNIVNQILQELSTLINEEPEGSNKIKYEIALTQLFHTQDKEVGYIEYHQGLTHKRNAAKIRRKEYFDAIENAVSQIESDLYFVTKNE